LKVKRLFDAEYIVKEIKTGPMLIVQGDKSVVRDVLKAVVIEHNGFFIFHFLFFFKVYYHTYCILLF